MSRRPMTATARRRALDRLNAGHKRGCAGKHAHGSKELAERQRLSLEARDAKKGRRPAAMHSYQCPRCTLWHVGHTPRVLLEPVHPAPEEQD